MSLVLRTSLLAISLWSIPTFATNLFTGLGPFNGANESYSLGINLAGTTVVGYATNGSTGYLESFRWTESTGIAGIGIIPNSSGNLGFAISSNANAIAGWSYRSSGNIEAFRWTSTDGIVGLGIPNNARDSFANAINSDGSQIVGNILYNDLTYQAFRWTASEGMVGLGQLNGGNYSNAYGINHDGSVVVGRATDGASSDDVPFRWTATGGMQSLGDLNGGRIGYATAINPEGNVIVGTIQNGLNGDGVAFRWTEASGIVGIGQLNGSDLTVANAVNKFGDVIVGTASNNMTLDQEAFRWSQGGGMQSVTTWLANAGISTAGFTKLFEATGVSGDGNTVVGTGKDTQGNVQAYLARVSNAGSGMVGITDLASSLHQTLAITSQMDGLTGLAMNGAHHRTLMDSAMTDGKSCSWVTGDLGRAYRQANGYLGAVETGICHDFNDQAIRIGAGIGSSYSDLDLANDGKSRLNGQYGVAELDWKLPDYPIILSLLGTYGQWDATLKRGYALVGTQPSKGNTDISSYSLRTRVDWVDAFHVGSVMYSPRLALTTTRTEVDGYAEQSGSAPATFQDQNHTAKEARLGLTGKYPLRSNLTLFGHGEVIHRFDKRGDTVQGNITALGVNLGSYRQQGNNIANNWVRLGLELDYKVNDASLLNASSFVSSQGQDADISAAISYRYLF